MVDSPLKRPPVVLVTQDIKKLDLSSTAFSRLPDAILNLSEDYEVLGNLQYYEDQVAKNRF